MRLLRLATLALYFVGAGVLCAAQEHITEAGIHVQYHPDDADIARRSLEILVDAREEFGFRLPMGEEPVRVVIAHRFSEFQKYTGRFSQMNVAGIARPAEGLIVVKSPRIMPPHSDYRGTLRHELVHILLERNTDTRALPKWLNEGICMSLANEYYWESMFTIARMYLGGRIQNYEDLDRNLRAPGDEMSFGDTYAQGLSMTRYLRDNLGEEKFWAVVVGVREMSFPEALEHYGGITLGEFWQGYRNSLWLTALLGSFGSGTLFIPAAFLLVIAWFRMRMKDRVIMERWEREEADAPPIVSLDELSEGEYEWELDDEEDEHW